MKLIICGGRHFNDHELFWREITAWIATHGRPTEVITGGATGADTMGHDWATAEGIPTRVFRADWSTHGRRAGPVRNEQMAWYARDGGAVLAFPGGRGTLDMITQAGLRGLHVTEIEL